ncbi:MAG: hypothetical protein GX130_13025 [Candidatus Hydrogenedens sp.]|jgi:hypothetical protein|nr:hypothetical protein [Candidatus Hydrogenedens sp.]
MKQTIHFRTWNMYPSLLLFISVCIIAPDVFSLNAPITPEMLLSLRALRGEDVARDPLIPAPVGAKGQTLSRPGKQKKMTLEWEEFSLSGSFNIRICAEGMPHTQFPSGDYSFDYSVWVNERLIDALERLVEASEGHVFWRLLEGRLVVTTTPKDDSLPIGDRMLQLNIDAETIGEAFLQLEKAYNEQYSDVPFTFHTTSLDFSDFTSSTGDAFRIQGKNKLRNSIISLLNQWDPAQANYKLKSYQGPHLAVDRQYARKYYYDNNLYYYGVTIHNIDADAIRVEARRSVIRLSEEDPINKEEEEYYLWLDGQARAMTRRLMGYFDRIYPEWAAEEDAN